MGPFLYLVVFHRRWRGYQPGTNFNLGESVSVLGYLIAAVCASALVAVGCGSGAGNAKNNGTNKPTEHGRAQSPAARRAVARLPQGCKPLQIRGLFERFFGPINSGDRSAALRYIAPRSELLGFTIYHGRKARAGRFDAQNPVRDVRRLRPAGPRRRAILAPGGCNRPRRALCYGAKGPNCARSNSGRRFCIRPWAALRIGQSRNQLRDWPLLRGGNGCGPWHPETADVRWVRPPTRKEACDVRVPVLGHWCAGTCSLGGPPSEGRARQARPRLACKLAVPRSSDDRLNPSEESLTYPFRTMQWQ
jgi:hypothetical protein